MRRSSTRTPPTTSPSTWFAGDKDGTAAAIEDAEVVVRQRLVNQRLIPNPMEVRGAIGRYEPGTDEYTVWMSSQTPHIMRLLITAFVLGIPEHKVRVHQPRRRRRIRLQDLPVHRMGARDAGPRSGSAVGPSSGSSRAARTTSAPSTAATTSRTSRSRALARAVITGLKVRTWANLGGRLSTIGPGVPTTLYGRVLSGPYAIPNVWCEVTGVYTNTVFVDAYRGAGRPEATYVVERAMDLFAAEIGMDRAEVRRRNFLPNDSLPAQERERALPVLERPGAVHRLGRLRAGPGAGAGDGRLRGPRRRQGRGTRRVASTWAWASPATSRCAVSRRPSGSVPWARAGVPRCGSRPTSRST